MKKKQSTLTNSRRSPCPVACSLDIFGDKWTLLVIRDLILGRSRFKEFEMSPESPPTNILTERLNRLIFHGIIEKIESSDGSKHKAYQLTKKGKALRPIVECIKDWGLKWHPGTDARLLPN
jgi:DNA-binding HxlR family transcriptional regulator